MNAAVTQFLSNGMIYGAQFLVPLYLVTGAGLSRRDARRLAARPPRGSRWRSSIR